MDNEFIIVFIDSRKMLYDISYSHNKKRWLNILSTLDKERYSAKFFGSENAKLNSNNYVKILEKKNYRKTKIPFCF